MPSMNMVAQSSAGAMAACGVAETHTTIRSQDRGKSLPTRTCGLAAIALALGLFCRLSAPASAQKTAEELAQQYGREAVERALETKRHYDLYGIHFDFDTATIQSQTQPLLDDIAAMLEDFPNWRLQIVGHTDSTGDPAHNERLSRERAAAVKAALVDRGIEAARLESGGAGESKPVASNDTPEGRALNRRVELVRLESAATAYSLVTDARLKSPNPRTGCCCAATTRDGCTARSPDQHQQRQEPDPGLELCDRRRFGHEAPPIVNDGVMFVAAPYDKLSPSTPRAATCSGSISASCRKASAPCTTPSAASACTATRST